MKKRSQHSFKKIIICCKNDLQNGEKQIDCYVPIISTTRNVSSIGSIISSGICCSLLFCRFSVSREFRLSKPIVGSWWILIRNHSLSMNTFMHYVSMNSLFSDIQQNKAVYKIFKCYCNKKNGLYEHKQNSALLNCCYKQAIQRTFQV